MPSNTTYFNLIKPNVNDPIDQDIWGGFLNLDFDTLDGLLKTLSNTAIGSARPSYVAAGTLWISNAASPWSLYVYDGTNDVLVGNIDPVNHVFTPVIPPVAAPTIATQLLTANTSYTPTTGMKYCIVEGVGGGGGGGGAAGGANLSAGGGGGSGGYFRKAFTAAQIGTSQTVLIGDGGLGGDPASSTGSTGGTTTFGSNLIAYGGAGGLTGANNSNPTTSAGGIGGLATGGDINFIGNCGGFGVTFDATGSGNGGQGAASYFGGSTQISFRSDGYAGNLYGGGGGGAGDASGGSGGQTGGVGAKGVVLVTEYI